MAWRLGELEDTSQEIEMQRMHGCKREGSQGNGGKRNEDVRIVVLVRHGREVGDLENGFRIERRLPSL